MPIQEPSRSQIRDAVWSIARDNGVRIQGARLRGSRLRNYHHDESDYDIAIVFTNDPIKHALVGEGPVSDIHDTDGELDVHGWNATKFASLLAGNDPNAITFARSPTDFDSPLPMADEIREMAVEQTNLASLYHHYLSMAKNQWGKYVKNGGGEVTRQFHVARGAMAASWIRTENEVPPLDITDLVEYEAENYDTGRLAELLNARDNGNGENGISDVTGEILSREAEAEFDEQKHRLTSPDRGALDDFIRECHNNPTQL
jgi:predicted nucleotidyltransferase